MQQICSIGQFHRSCVPPGKFAGDLRLKMCLCGEVFLVWVGCSVKFVEIRMTLGIRIYWFQLQNALFMMSVLGH